jgi:hypothetical protein
VPATGFAFGGYVSVSFFGVLTVFAAIGGVLARLHADPLNTVNTTIAGRARAR